MTIWNLVVLTASTAPLTSRRSMAPSIAAVINHALLGRKFCRVDG